MENDFDKNFVWTDRTHLINLKHVERIESINGATTFYFNSGNILVCEKDMDKLISDFYDQIYSEPCEK